MVPITDNLAAWLEPLDRTGKVVGAKQHHRDVSALAEGLGINWPRNVLRHSFISYRIAKVKSADQVALEAGNSPSIIFKHYLELTTEGEADKWFLNPREDVRSSYYLEDVATEFDAQGLELDWACVVWDGDFRYTEDGWQTWSFRGSKWQRILKNERRRYLINAYRVLLTRARQGLVIVVPEGDPEDPTRGSNFHDATFSYLRAAGLALLT